MQPVFMRKQSKLQLYMTQSLLDFYLQTKKKYKENDSLSLMIYSIDTVIYRSRKNSTKTIFHVINPPGLCRLWKLSLFCSAWDLQPQSPRTFCKIETIQYTLSGIAMIMKQKKNNIFCLLDAQLDYKIKIWSCISSVICICKQFTNSGLNDIDLHIQCNSTEKGIIVSYLNKQ